MPHLSNLYPDPKSPEAQAAGHENAKDTLVDTKTIKGVSYKMYKRADGSLYVVNGDTGQSLEGSFADNDLGGTGSSGGSTKPPKDIVYKGTKAYREAANGALTRTPEYDLEPEEAAPVARKRTKLEETMDTISAIKGTPSQGREIQVPGLAGQGIDPFATGTPGTIGRTNAGDRQVIGADPSKNIYIPSFVARIDPDTGKGYTADGTPVEGNTSTGFGEIMDAAWMRRKAIEYTGISGGQRGYDSSILGQAMISPRNMTADQIASAAELIKYLRPRVPAEITDPKKVAAYLQRMLAEAGMTVDPLEDPSFQGYQNQLYGPPKNQRGEVDPFALEKIDREGLPSFASGGSAMVDMPMEEKMRRMMGGMRSFAEPGAVEVEALPAWLQALLQVQAYRSGQAASPFQEGAVTSTGGSFAPSAPLTPAQELSAFFKRFAQQGQGAGGAGQATAGYPTPSGSAQGQVRGGGIDPFAAAPGYPAPVADAFGRAMGYEGIQARDFYNLDNLPSFALPGSMQIGSPATQQNPQIAALIAALGGSPAASASSDIEEPAAPSRSPQQRAQATATSNPAIIGQDPLRNTPAMRLRTALSQPGGMDSRLGAFPAANWNELLDLVFPGGETPFAEPLEPESELDRPRGRAEAEAYRAAREQREEERTAQYLTSFLRSNPDLSTFSWRPGTPIAGTPPTAVQQMARTLSQLGPELTGLILGLIRGVPYRNTSGLDSGMSTAGEAPSRLPFDAYRERGIASFANPGMLTLPEPIVLEGAASGIPYGTASPGEQIAFGGAPDPQMGRMQEQAGLQAYQQRGMGLDPFAAPMVMLPVDMRRDPLRMLRKAMHKADPLRAA